MKSLQIGDNDLYGRRFNGHDLKNDLIARGIDSRHLVWLKHSEESTTQTFASDQENRIFADSFVREIEMRYSLHSILCPFTHSIFYEDCFLDADVVHMHLLHNSHFNLNVLPLLTRLKPAVWTLHDPWALTGHCVHPGDCTRWKTGCGECPHLNAYFPIQEDATALNWEIKKSIFAQTRADIIVASPWMKRMAEQSPLMAGFDIHLVPFGTKLDKYCPGDSKAAKKSLNIPAENIVISFRTQKVFKGSDYAREALAKLNVDAPITLLTSGGAAGQIDEFRSRFQIVELGWTTDEKRMIEMYRASDIFLMPSTEETFGMMAMEAMACGKPIIVFEGTALPDTVFAPDCGIAVRRGDTDALAGELTALIAHGEKRLQLGAKARKLAEQYYDNENYVSKIIEVYKEVIGKRRPDERSKYIVGQLKDIVNPTPCRDQEAKANRPKGQLVLSAANSFGETTPAIIHCARDSIRELEQIKSSVYYRAYDKLRKYRPLRYLSNAIVKPALTTSWRTYKVIQSLLSRSPIFR